MRTGLVFCFLVVGRITWRIIYGWFSYKLISEQFVYHFCAFRWILLEVLDKVSPGSVNWKHASKPPIKMPFRKVENCNQVVKIGKQLKFSLVNVAGNDIVQGNKKLILGNASILSLLLYYFRYCLPCLMFLCLVNLLQLSYGNWWDSTCFNCWETSDPARKGRRLLMPISLIGQTTKSKVQAELCKWRASRLNKVWHCFFSIQLSFKTLIYLCLLGFFRIRACLVDYSSLSF